VGIDLGFEMMEKLRVFESEKHSYNLKEELFVEVLESNRIAFTDCSFTDKESPSLHVQNTT
jgi:hypothetical protein